MIEFSVDLIGIDELRATFSALSGELREAIGAKLEVLTEALRQKVVENVSGILLQKQSGALAESIVKEVDINSEVMEGFVVPRPADEKAWVHEFGGKGYYDIYPFNKNNLKFEGKDGETVFAKHVWHPPAEAKYYLRLALLDMEPEINEGFQEVLDHIVGLR